MAERFLCPSADCGKSYASLQGLKIHMQAKHGGYTAEEIAQASEPPVIPEIQSEASQQPAELPPPPPPAIQPQTEEPKRITRRSRELNDKLNTAIQLCVNHFTRGLTDIEKEELDVIRREVTAACFGVEFDFEERLFTLRSKIWLFVALGILYSIEKLPNFSEMVKMFKEETTKGHKEKEPEHAAE